MLFVADDVSNIARSAVEVGRLPKKGTMVALLFSLHVIKNSDRPML